MGFKKGHKINAGRIPWNKNKPWSQETKKKISKALKGTKQKVKRKVTRKLKETWVKNLYKDGKSPWLGKKLTKKHRQKCRKAQLREKSWNWKGGKTKSFGYIKAYNPNHPFAVGNYVFEHRLIMEKMLGRYLRPKEKVHHMNSIRDDNRPENLKLIIHGKNWHSKDCPKCGFSFLIK